MFHVTDKEVISKANVVILPSVSIGNCGQLAADIFIATFKLRRVAVYYGDALLPFCAVDENGALLHGCELFGADGFPLLVVQLRSLFVSKPAFSGTIGTRNEDEQSDDTSQASPERRFVSELLNFLIRETSQPRLTVLNVTSGCAASLSDPDMRSRVAQYVVDAKQSVENEADGLVALERRSFQRPSALFYLPGSGFSHALARLVSRRTHKTYDAERPVELALRVVAVYADRGDCRSDAAKLCCGAWHVLRNFCTPLQKFEQANASPAWLLPLHWNDVYADMLP